MEDQLHIYRLISVLDSLDIPHLLIYNVFLLSVPSTPNCKDKNHDQQVDKDK